VHDELRIEPSEKEVKKLSEMAKQVTVSARSSACRW
jgi:hypothetical protein